jgi:hypothetical protein
VSTRQKISIRTSRLHLRLVDKNYSFITEYIEGMIILSESMRVESILLEKLEKYRIRQPQQYLYLFGSIKARYLNLRDICFWKERIKLQKWTTVIDT